MSKRRDRGPSTDRRSGARRAADPSPARRDPYFFGGINRITFGFKSVSSGREVYAMKFDGGSDGADPSPSQSLGDS